MASQASKRYELKTKIRPLRTRQRHKMYDSLQVSPSRRSLSPHSPLDTVSRQTRDSYLLRITKQTTLNTNYTPMTQSIKTRSRRPVIDKAKFERIIGDVRDEDFSLPLVENANKRCHKAHEKLAHQSKIVNVKDLHKFRKNHEHIKFEKQLNRDPGSNPQEQNREFNRQKSIKKMQSLKSTQVSYNMESTIDYDQYPIEKRGSKLHEALKRIRNFEHSPGHVYGSELFKPNNNPEPYDISESNEAFVKKSMSNPRGYTKFDLYRDHIAMRSDRIDPNWGMHINYEDLYINPSREHSTISIKKNTERKPLQVFNKYPIRQNMSLQIPNNRRE